MQKLEKNPHESNVKMCFSQRSRGTSASSRLERTACRFTDHSRTLAFSTRTTHFISLSYWNTFFGIYGARLDRKWIGALGVYIVSLFLSMNGCRHFNINLIFYFSAKSLRTSSNVFVLNLAFCDFLMMSKIPILVYNSFHQGMALGPFWCEYYGLIGSVSGVGAAITNAFIAYDRSVVSLNSALNQTLEMLFLHRTQIQRHRESNEWEIDDDKSNFLSNPHLVLCATMGVISVFQNVGTLCTR